MKQIIRRLVRELQVQQIIVRMWLQILVLQIPEHLEVAMTITRLPDCGLPLTVVETQITVHRR